jgi:hypothetical protein
VFGHAFARLAHNRSDRLLSRLVTYPWATVRRVQTEESRLVTYPWATVRRVQTEECCLTL